MHKYVNQNLHPFLLIRHLGGSLVSAFAASALFALHPVNAEAVTYISSRSESLCATFYILAFFFFQASDPKRIGFCWWRLLGVVSFALALMSKSVAITLPALLLVFELLRSRTGSIPSRLGVIASRHWPFWIVGCVYLVITADIVTSAVGADSVRGVSQQLGTQIKALVYYAVLLWFPTGLSVEHQFRIAPGLLSADVILPGVLVVSAGFAIWRCRDRLSIWGVWLIWPVVALLPTIVVPLNVLVNEHRLYLPAVAFSVLFGVALGRFVERNRLVGLLAASILITTYAVLAHDRSLTWRDSDLLWSDALEKGPLMPRPHIYVGDGYFRRGDYERALAEYRTALHIYPEALSPLDRVVALNNMGASYLKTGRFTEAVRVYHDAVRIDSTYTKSRDALEALLALREDPGSSRAKELYKRGLVQFAARRFEEAVTSFTASVSVHPLNRTWLALALTYESLEAWEKAAQTYEVLEMVATGQLRTTATEGILRNRVRLKTGEVRASDGERGAPDKRISSPVCADPHLRRHRFVFVRERPAKPVSLRRPPFDQVQSPYSIPR